MGKDRGKKLKKEGIIHRVKWEDEESKKSKTEWEKKKNTNQMKKEKIFCTYFAGKLKGSPNPTHLPTTRDGRAK